MASNDELRGFRNDATFLQDDLPGGSDGIAGDIPWIPSTTAKGLSPRALARVQAYIAAHLGESFSLSDLANAACISRFHFARRFRAGTGRSPMEFVPLPPMEAAKPPLAQVNQKIAATAAALGFFDQSHFTRTFRRVTGVSPRAFSRQQPNFTMSDPAVSRARSASRA